MNKGGQILSWVEHELLKQARAARFIHNCSAHFLLHLKCIDPTTRRNKYITGEL